MSGQKVQLEPYEPEEVAPAVAEVRPEAPVPAPAKKAPAKKVAPRKAPAKKAAAKESQPESSVATFEQLVENPRPGCRPFRGEDQHLKGMTVRVPPLLDRAVSSVAIDEGVTKASLVAALVAAYLEQKGVEW